MTVAEALRMAADRLAEKGLRFPREDSEWLVAWAIDANRSFLYTHPEARLSPNQVERFAEALRQREDRYPLQYLSGEQEFYGRSFRIDPSTLIPRPETELLVEVALAELRSRDATDPRIVDVGTGSGCIAVTMACEMPALRATAVDISPAALAVARSNARRWDCGDRIEFIVGDALAELASQDGAYDLIVSNPPYLAWERRGEVDPSVLRYEPRHALFAEDGGLAVYRKLFLQSPPLLKPGGRLVVELGYDLHRAVSALAAGAGWAELMMRRDLAGLARCALYGRRAGSPLESSRRGGSV